MKEHNWVGWGRTVVWMAPLVALAGCQVLFGVELPAEDAAGAGGGGQAGAAKCNLCGAFFDGALTSAACVDNGPPTSFALTTALTGCLCRSDTCGSTDCKAVCETNAAPSKACKACSVATCEAETQACLLDNGKGSAGGVGGQGDGGSSTSDGMAGQAWGAGGGGQQGNECGERGDCEACCAEREGFELAEIGRDYFQACFCDSLNNSGSGYGCDNASADCEGCCADLCEGSGTSPSPEQIDRCSLCAFNQSGNQAQCSNVIEYSCFSRGLVNCSLRTCASNECGP